ncbi:MAG TPA: glycosyltransferase family 1 protein [Candidatus Saccharimonadales bacterium]|nr:glycosyltransferase family 1 protein [Candidatus Saccharimonadales bacterium]
MSKTKIFIEAVPLVDKQMSGVPHALAGIVAAMAANKEIMKNYELILVAPKNRLHLLDRWPGLQNCSRKAIPMKFRIMNGLGRRGLLPPMDLLLGRGIYFFGNFFNWPLTKSSKSFTYIHDICFATHPELVQPDNQKMLAKNVPRYIRQTDYVIAVSETSRREIISEFNVPESKVKVVYNAADTSAYSKTYSVEEVKQTQQKYGVFGDKYFLFISNIEPRKNIERLIGAIEKLPKDVGLFLVGGDGWLNEKVFKMIDEQNKKGRKVIKPKTYVDDEDAAKLLQGSLGLTMPSIYEGFGMPALESLTMGKPTVVSNIPQFKEVAGEVGFYCDYKNIDSIATALQKVLDMNDTERTNYSQKAKKQASKFSWDKSAAVLASLFNQVKL